MGMLSINRFDQSVISFFNQFSRKSEIVDRLIIFLSNNDLFKGGLIMIIFWWIWFLPSEEITLKRRRLLSTVCGCLVALLVVRILVMTTHLRERPLFNGAVHLMTPLGFDRGSVPNKENSFPSDHATMFFAFATGLFYISKKTGFLTLLYVLLLVALPRVYIALHYPTDILAGAFIGVLVVIIANTQYLTTNVSGKLLKYADSHPQPFYAILFLLSFQMATLFDSIRNILHFGGTILRLYQ
jgi:undecaprenyl-diphosphatase